MNTLRQSTALRNGENIVDGVPVVVSRRKAKSIIIRIRHDGSVALTIPARRATLSQAARFLMDKWEWVLKARERVLSRTAPATRQFSQMEIARLQTLLGELHMAWAARLGEPGVPWKLRSMKTRWGVCNFVKRRVTYAVMLAAKPRECVEYVVVHELSHLKAHGHGADFKALMDQRLPDWRIRRKLLRE